MTALVLVRPFVSGEGPGQLSDFSHPGGMTVTLLTLVGCAGWAIWRMWSKQQALPLGPVEIGLFALALVYFIGAGFAPYARAGYLAASEWLGLALLVFFARQLVTRPEEQQGLLAVLLATAVALSVQGIWQESYELPALAREAERQEWSIEDAVQRQAQGRLLTPTDLEKAQLVDQLRRRTASGPFFHPSSLAICLLLLLPGLAGAVAACVRSRSPRWLTITVGTFAVLAAVLLALTRFAPAMAVLALVGLGSAGLAWPARWGGPRAGVPGGLVLGALMVLALYLGGDLPAHLARWREAWPIAWRLVEDHLWRGVGPAQFAFYYPRYMPATAGHRMVEPASAPLEILADVGPAGLLLLLLLLAVFFRVVLRWWRAEGTAGSEPAAPPAPPPVTNPDEPPLRWEYYLGGMVGAVLTFTLRVGPLLESTDIIPEAIAAGIRAVAWFFAFGALERVAWSRGEYVGGLVVGIAAVLLTFLVAPGLTWPSVAGLLWLAVALVLALVAPPVPGWLGRQGWIGPLALPLFLGGGFAYVALIYWPATLAASNTQKARLSGALLVLDRQREPADRTISDYVPYIDQRMLAPLREADRDDPGNLRTCELLAQWYGNMWTSDPTHPRNFRLGKQGLGPAQEVAELARRAREEQLDGLVSLRLGVGSLVEALDWARKARQANRQAENGYAVAHRVRVQIAESLAVVARESEKEAAKAEQEAKKPPPKAKPAKEKDSAAREKDRIAQLRRRAGELRKRALLARFHRQQQLELAAKALEPSLPLNPTDPRLRFRLAATLFDAGKASEGRVHALEAQRLDALAGRPRSLSKENREKLERWLKGRSPP